MATKHDLEGWILDAVDSYGGSAGIVDIAEHIWVHHESDLRKSGSLFYTWQYDMRWAALKLRKSGELRATANSPTGTWER
jgi:hypothetical protein